MSRSRRVRNGVLSRLEIRRAAPPPKVRMYLESEAATTPELLLCGSVRSGLRVGWMNRMADPGGIDKAFAPRAGRPVDVTHYVRLGTLPAPHGTQVPDSFGL